MHKIMKCHRFALLLKIAFVVISLLGPVSVFASESPMSLTLAVEDSWPPYAKKDGTGISRTIIEQALAPSGIKLEFFVVPYARALKLTADGVVDGAFNVTRQPSTTNTFVFGQEPLLQAAASYFYPPTEKFDYISPKDIPNGTAIALIIGYEYGDEYEAHRHRFDEVRVSSQKQIIRLLIERKVDMAIMFDDVADYTLGEMRLDAYKIRKGRQNHVSNIYVAFSKKRPDIDKKIALLDRALKAYRQKN